MIAYLDSSVILRRILGEPGRLEKWNSIADAVSSEIGLLECLRTIDRLRLKDGLDAKTVTELRELVYRLFDHLEVLDVSRSVLSRAASPFPTPLRTLDAIHLSSALLWQETRNQPLVMATHDDALSLAARAMGLSVLGS